MKRFFSFFLVFLLIFSFSTLSFASGSNTFASSFFDLPANIYQFVKNIFVPREDYFHNKLQELSNLVNDRFGALGELYLSINSFFNRLFHLSFGALEIHFPNNFGGSGLRGFSFNCFSIATPLISFIRSVVGGFICLITFISCYHKLRAFFTEQE